MIDENVDYIQLARRERLRRKRKPTIMQIRALQYINQGMSKNQAMLKAGYSKKSSKNPKQNLMEKDGVRNALESMKNELINQGLTIPYMANKMKEFMEAKKIHGSPTEPDKEVPDYNVQMKAYDRWKQAFGEGVQTEAGVKRKMTITEFVMGDKE